MALKEYIETLSEDKRIDLAIELLELGLPIWNEYSSKKQKLEYVDTVVGMAHSVDREIINRVLDTSKRWKNKGVISKDLEQLNVDFDDPIVALQDLDWEIPENIQLIFYSAYNLVGKMNGETKTLFGDEQLYLVINQIVDGLTKSGNFSFDQINSIISKYKAPNKK